MRSDLFFGYPCFLPGIGVSRQYWYAAVNLHVLPHETVPFGTSIILVPSGTKNNDFLEPEQGT